MEGSIRLTVKQRKELLKAYRSGEDAQRSRRAHVVLLLDGGASFRDLQRWLFASNELIVQCLRRFREGGVSKLLEGHGDQEAVVPRWLVLVMQWIDTKTPQDFGFFRTRWSCDILAEVLAWETGIRLSGETVRRGMRRLGFVWRRPRPTVGPTDPDFQQKLAKIRRLLATIPADETAVFEDEVDVNLNPKIGSCWMRRGQQAEVKTPGNNVKRYLAGSLHWRTGTLLISPPGTHRNTDLFLEHLDHLRQRLRGYRLIHVICDNAAFHASRPVREYLATWADRIRLHFLPTYSPETNPIERIWWHMHETLTRNHRCQSIDELLQNVYDYFTLNNNHYQEMRSVFAAAA